MKKLQKPQEKIQLTHGDQIYSLDHIIGSGGFGAIWLAKDKSNNVRAIKVIDLSEHDDVMAAFKNIHDEIDYLKLMKNDDVCYEHISCYYDSWLDMGNKIAYIVMEYIDGWTLNEYLKTINKSQKNLYALYIFYVVSQVIDYIHQKGVLHLDLNTNNILVDKKGTIKIIDFGLSCLYTDKANICPKLKPCCPDKRGTPGFMAPETIFSSLNYKSTDVWLLGASLYNALTGKYISPSPEFPEEATEWKKWVIGDLKGDIKVPELNTGFKILDRLVNGCLQYKPEKRITPAYIKQQLDKINFKGEFEKRRSETPNPRSLRKF